MSDTLPARLDNKTELVIMQGDLAKLSSEERLAYVNNVCASLGLNPLTRPFDYIQFQGKLVLYARKDAAEQLRKIHGVSIEIKSRDIVDGIYIVSAKAKDKNGKEDEASGAIPIEGLKGADKANAMMKAETKAKRRVTISICGLGILDESDIEDESASAREATAVAPPPPPALTASGDEWTAKVLDLVGKFRKLKVNAAMICGRYDLDDVGKLTQSQYDELNQFGFDIVNGKKKIADVFPQNSGVW